MSHPVDNNTNTATPTSSSTTSNNSTGFSSSPVWESDSDVLNCRLCNTEFNLFTRRHHCE